MAQMCTQTCTIRVVCVQSDLKCPESPRPCHAARWQGSWALAQSQAHAGHSEGASPAIQHSPHPAPPSHLQGRTRSVLPVFSVLYNQVHPQKLKCPKPRLPFETKWNFTGSPLERKGKPSHTGKEDPKTVLLKRI